MGRYDDPDRRQMEADRDNRIISRMENKEPSSELMDMRKVALEKAEYFGTLINAQYIINGSVRLRGEEYERYKSATEVILLELFKQRTEAFELYFIMSMQLGEGEIIEAKFVAKDQFKLRFKTINGISSIEQSCDDDIENTFFL
jgi:hypothetical protein